MTAVDHYDGRATSIRLDSNVLRVGETATVQVEGVALPHTIVGKPCMLALSAVDKERGLPQEPLAQFEVVLRRNGVGQYAFASVRRIDDRPRDLPESARLRSADGRQFRFSTHWKPAHIVLAFEGVRGEHVVLLDGGQRRIETMIFELGLELKLGDAMKFHSFNFPTYVDCWAALAHNCVQAAKLDYWGHRDLVDRYGIGTHYGTESGDRGSHVARHRLGATNCIRYVLDTLTRGYEATLGTADWNFVKGHVRDGKGTLLSKGLVADGWEAVYYNPDSRNPDDYEAGSRAWQEHTYTADQAKKGAPYYDIAIRDAVVDYRPTRDPELMRVQPATVPQRDKIRTLNRVPFGVVMARGGKHTALYVAGEVWEVHWDRNSDDPLLFEATSLQHEWPWLSGVVVMPRHCWPAGRR